MPRWPAAVIVSCLVALVLVPVTSGAPYLQFGVDAGRTGHSEDPGPETFDVAFPATLPGRPAYLSVPLILDGAILALLEAPAAEQTPDGMLEPVPDVAGLYRIDLTTAEVDRIVAYEGAPSSLASDGGLVFIAAPNAIQAYRVKDWQRVWAWPFPASALDGENAPQTSVHCAPLAVAGDSVFVACNRGIATYDRARQNPLLVEPMASAFVARLYASNGTLVWDQPWFRLECSPVSLLPCASTPNETPQITSLAVTEDRVVVGGVVSALIDSQASAGTSGPEFTEIPVVSAFDLSTGEWTWSRSTPMGGGIPDGLAASNIPFPGLVATTEVVYILTSQLLAVATDTGTLEWSAQVTPFDPGNRFDSPSEYRGGALALQDERLFASGDAEVVAFDVGSGRPTEGWRTSTGDADTDLMHGMLVYADLVLAGSFQDHLMAFDTNDGNPRHFEEYGGQAGLRYAVGDGVVAVLNLQGGLYVLGTAPASIRLAVTLSSLYPDAGQPAQVDLSRTAAGALGPATKFRVDWGDGTKDAWQPSPRFEHVYRDPGVRVARVYAGNNEGQVSSQAVTFDVGGSPPVPPTFLERQFAASNQERTFFVLGLAVTALAAAIGATRLRRRRSRLQRELEELESEHAAARGDPTVAGQVLAGRRTRTRRLLADGTIDAAEASMLERRIDELGASGRLDTIEDRFGFLSLSTARALRGMLADGRIQRWEREHFLAALRQDKYLTTAQKAKVQGQVEEWFHEDVRA